MKRITVWDPLVRITHWCVAALVLSNLFNPWINEGSQWHRWSGYAACTLVAIRLIWGFVGTRHARFSDWFPWPSKVLAYVRATLRGQHPEFIGHNPLGSVMMLALWAMILTMGVSGYMMGLDEWYGVEWLENVHEYTAWLIQISVVLHVLAAIVGSKQVGYNLIASMIHGKKPLPAANDEAMNKP
ncbi:cytochrome b/b6 domain-containing protein [Amphibiibacter pelophylacis]|uniref:Cytochrome b/b6 domain-containing protein n=1 Tax=Amphibiibacter pelophylacis TaxID=1799477 RepID=A0ACC6P475_9BURK